MSVKLYRDRSGQPEGAPIATQAAPYGARLRANLDAQRPTTMPPAWVLDKIADESLHGGFTGSRYGTCPSCFLKFNKNAPHAC
jgi:hypothetical protein